MDINFFESLCMPIVMAFCLVVGYILKHWVKDVDNKWIPTIVTILGVISACLYKQDVTFTLVVSGALSGLASTGLHQLLKQFLEKVK